MRITRRLEFDAGHRIPQHDSQCRHLHGRYVAQLPLLHEAVEAARRDIPLRLTPRRRSARSIKMSLAAKRRAAGGQR